MLHFPKPAPRKRDPQSHPQCRTCPLILLPIFRRHKRCNLVVNSYTQLPLSSLTRPETVLLVQEHRGLVCAAFVLCSSFSIPPSSSAFRVISPWFINRSSYPHPLTDSASQEKKNKKNNETWAAWSGREHVRASLCPDMCFSVVPETQHFCQRLSISPSIWNGSRLLRRSSQQALCSLCRTSRCRRPRPLLPSQRCSGTLLGWQFSGMGLCFFR